MLALCSHWCVRSRWLCPTKAWLSPAERAHLGWSWLDLGTLWSNDDGDTYMHDCFINTYSVPVQSWAPYAHYPIEFSQQSQLMYMSKQILRQVQLPGQACTASKQRIQGLYPGLFPPEPGLPIPEKIEGKGSG